MAGRSFGWGNFAWRYLFAALLVGATYNPEGWSYAHWALREIGSFNALKALAGLALLVGWTIYIRATLRSLGPIGLLLAAALFGSLVWVLIDLDWVDPQSTRAVTYLVLFVLATVMAVGVSWSHVRRRISGQVDADDVDE